MTMTTISLHPTVFPPAWNPSMALKLVVDHPAKLAKYTYGTAGFRFDANVMDAVLVRVGIFCVWWYPQLQTASTHEVNTIGIMVTASHNDESYNGVKLVNCKGEILSDDVVCQQLTDFVNGQNTVVEQWLQGLVAGGQTEPAVAESKTSPPSPTCIIHVGHDTRSHSPSLTTLAVQAIQALGGQVLHHGVATTPVLHHVVSHQNPHNVPSLIPIRPDAIGYYHLLAWSYLALLRTTASTTVAHQTKHLVVDCACGVGFPSVDCFNLVLKEVVSPARPPPTTTTFQPINGPEDGILNENCGSEYVLKVRGPPKVFDANDDASSKAKKVTNFDYAAAFDGDADRIVFFGGNDDKEFFFFDGDKITTLVCAFLQGEVAALKEACAGSSTLEGQTITLGAVQTAYANGASTQYLRTVLGKDNVLIAKTGVRHCHHAAKHFDIGVYFEANGHGTVVFGPNFYSYLAQADAFFMEKEQSRPKSLLRLRVLPSLINQAVGDALSDLLLVDSILHIKGWDLKQWSSLYEDLPSRMTKLKVQDRSVVETNENDTICLAPVGVQHELDLAMNEFEGRCFVRPSGTEDVVRVYAEAATPEICHKLSVKAELIVYNMCFGVGDPPE